MHLKSPAAGVGGRGEERSVYDCEKLQMVIEFLDMDWNSETNILLNSFFIFSICFADFAFPCKNKNS
jgi:hypothetical protein